MEYVRGIWERDHLTNAGLLSLKLEEELRAYLGSRHLIFMNNATTALQIAIRALGLKGEIITTPFSFVATTSSIVWQGCTPIFADIDPLTLTVDPEQVEKAITPRTSAILAVHVFGNPCDVEAIETIGKKYRLKIVYDAAHAFGTEYKGKSLCNYGDASVLSFHATKLYHTVEGGALVTANGDLAEKSAAMRNFGYGKSDEIECPGINAKNSEFHAAMGLCNLPRVSQFIEKRRYLCGLYSHHLLSRTTDVRQPQIRQGTDYNCAYFPLVFRTFDSLRRVLSALNERGIFPRRYFYPSLAELNYVKKVHMPVALEMSRKVLCLPLYTELRDEQVRAICAVTLKALSSKASIRIMADLGDLDPAVRKIPAPNGA